MTPNKKWVKPDLQAETRANETASHAERIERRIAIVTVFTPPLISIVGIWFWWRSITAVDICLFLSMYCFTILGITMGFHRLFSHRSFQCGKAMRFLLGIAGSMAVQGPLFFWSATHRKHHKYSDREGDPHSPHIENSEKISVKGFLHAHVGWMITGNKPLNYIHLVPDLIRDKVAFRINRLYFVWVLTGLVLPAITGGLFTLTWPGVLEGLFFGGFFRIFMVHQSTWTVNSICHLFGSTSYATNDRSKNNYLFALFTFGESWHNNHHAFPTSPNLGLKWWQLDLTYKVIKTAASIGLVWDLRLPDQNKTIVTVGPARLSDRLP